MREFKKGNKVLVACEVHSLPDDSDCFLTVQVPTSDGGYRLVEVSEPNCTLIDPDALKVGDRVDVEGNGRNRIIREQVVGYRLEGSANRLIYAHDKLTKLPSEPTHSVRYENDRLLLFSSGNDSESYGSGIGMDCPDAVQTTINAWESKYGIDADEARKLIAVPALLDELPTARYVSFQAWRHADGWSVVCVCGAPGISKIVATQIEKIAKAMFPTIKGPYLTETP
jgi:hypothetical protein